MKKIYLAAVLMSLFFNASSQSLIAEDDWNKLISNLESENWQQANSVSLACLKKIPIDQIEGPEAGLLRYMYICSEAGLMYEQKRTKAQAQKDVIAFINHNIVLPAHPVSTKMAANSIQMKSERADTLFINMTNKVATNIFAFEYVVLKEKWTVDEFNSKNRKFYRLSGTLKSINTEGNMFPRFRIMIVDAIANVEEH
jgi:hypothetical protein